MIIHNQKDYAPSKGGKRKRIPLIRTLILLFFIYSFYNHFKLPEESLPSPKKNAHSEEIKLAVAPPQQDATKANPPEGKEDKFRKIFLSRQKDPLLGSRLLDVLKSQKPFGAFYMMVDGSSGEILAWGEQKNFASEPLPDYLPQNTFPAASLVKIVTAAAALESRRYSNHSRIPSIGKTTTLFRQQLEVPRKYRGKKVSLENIFALSMNPPMGIIGLDLGGKALEKTALKLGFNLEFTNKTPLPSIYNIPDSGFGVAEAATGFTDKITISPLHAAAIVRSVLRGEPPELPWSHVTGKKYAPPSPVKLPVSRFKHNTYYGMRRMFEATIKRGSARKSFNNPRVLYPYNRKRFRIGGKTGTVNKGNSRYEWFTGYVQDRKDVKTSLILVCLHINELKGTRASHPAQAAALLTNHWSKLYVDW